MAYPHAKIVQLDHDGLKEIGCTARVTEVLERMDDGRMNVLVEGSTPFRLFERHEQHLAESDLLVGWSGQQWRGSARPCQRSVLHRLVRRLPHYAVKTEWITALELDDDQNQLRRSNDPLATAIIRLSDLSKAGATDVTVRDLEKAALVSSATGRAGGFTLSREPGSITLADIYRAVEDEGTFRMHKTDPQSRCPVGCQILKILSMPLQSAENALAHSLAKTTLKDIAAQIA